MHERAGPTLGTRARASGWAVALMLVVVFGIGAAVVIGLGLNRGRGQFDQINYHLPVVRQFETQWPRVDLRDYQSATAPGYHLVLAGLARAGVRSENGLRAASAVWTAAMLGVFGFMLAARGREAGTSAGTLVMLGLATVCSMYVFTPGAWLQPDNAGWLGVLGMVALTWPLVNSGTALSAWRWAACGAVLAALVFVRQSHLWAGGLVGAAVLARWIGMRTEGDGQRDNGSGRSVGWLVKTGAVWGLAVVPGVMVVAWMARMWGGLTPPSFQGQHAGGNMAAPAFGLALIGAYSVFFGAWLVEGWRTAVRDGREWVVMAAVAVGAVLAIVPETTFVYEARSSGLWNVVKAMDARGMVLFGRTNPLIVLMSTWGAAATAMWMMTLTRAQAVYALCLLGGFLAAQAANANAWQRYFEPLLLMMVALMAAGTRVNGRAVGVGQGALPEGFVGHARVALKGGPLVLAGLLGVLTVNSLTRTEVFDHATNPKAIPGGGAGVGTPPKGP